MQENPNARAKRAKNTLSVALLVCAVLLSVTAPFLDAAVRTLADLLVRIFAAGAILLLLAAEDAFSLGGRLIPRTPITCAAVFFIFLVALNNFPFYDLLSHRASVSVSFPSLALYTLSALATAAFEEALFRGLLFPLVRAKTKRTLRGELAALTLSSALFALLHLVNLIAAPLPATLLQVAYTFGIGLFAGLLCLLFRGLFPSFLFHALYNFGGLFLSSFGTLPPAAPFTVISTALLAILAGGLSLLALAQLAQEENVHK